MIGKKNEQIIIELYYLVSYKVLNLLKWVSVLKMCLKYRHWSSTSNPLSLLDQGNLPFTSAVSVSVLGSEPVCQAAAEQCGKHPLPQLIRASGLPGVKPELGGHSSVLNGSK